MSDPVVIKKNNPIVVFFASIGLFFVLSSIAFVFIVGVFFKSSFNKISQIIPDSKIEKGTKYIAAIKLEGIVDSKLSDKIINTFKKNIDNPDIVAFLIEVNSPGGHVVSAQEVLGEIDIIKEKKPVFAYVRDLSASAAYYIISSVNKIYAYPGSLIGSIGVRINTLSIVELLKKYGIKSEILASGDLKTAGDILTEMTEKQRKYIIGLMEDFYKQFKNTVIDNRKMTLESFENNLADGKVTISDKAVEYGLVDKIISNRKEVIEDIKKEIDYKEEELEIKYLKNPMMFESLMDYSNL